MENNTRRKRSQSAAQRKGKKDSIKNRTGINPAPGNTKKIIPLTEVSTGPLHSPLNISLNPETARQAVILSEIIGKPVSRRGKRR